MGFTPIPEKLVRALLLAGLPAPAVPHEAEKGEEEDADGGSNRACYYDYFSAVMVWARVGGGAWIWRGRRCLGCIRALPLQHNGGVILVGHKGQEGLGWRGGQGWRTEGLDTFFEAVTKSWNIKVEKGLIALRRGRKIRTGGSFLGPQTPTFKNSPDHPGCTV